MKYIFTCRSITDTVVVPGELIDEYMKNASGEYIKIYLYILRHANMELAAEDIADALNVTEGDVERAISYWERAEAILKIGVISIADPHRKASSQVYSSVRSILLSQTDIPLCLAMLSMVSLVILSSTLSVNAGVTSSPSLTIKKQEPGPSETFPK